MAVTSAPVSNLKVRVFCFKHNSTNLEASFLDPRDPKNVGWLSTGFSTAAPMLAETAAVLHVNKHWVLLPVALVADSVHYNCNFI